MISSSYLTLLRLLTCLCMVPEVEQTYRILGRCEAPGFAHIAKYFLMKLWSCTCQPLTISYLRIGKICHFCLYIFLYFLYSKCRNQKMNLNIKFYFDVLHSFFLITIKNMILVIFLNKSELS